MSLVKCIFLLVLMVSNVVDKSEATDQSMITLAQTKGESASSSRNPEHEPTPESESGQRGLLLRLAAFTFLLFDHETLSLQGLSQQILDRLVSVRRIL